MLGKIYVRYVWYYRQIPVFMRYEAQGSTAEFQLIPMDGLSLFSTIRVPMNMNKCLHLLTSSEHT